MTSDRLSGRVEPDTTPIQVRPPASHSSAKECLANPKDAPARVTAPAVRRLSAQLLPVDYCVIDTLRTVRIASGQQLRRLYWADSESGKRLARHHLAKLTKLRFIARLDRRVGGVRAGSDGFIYTLDVGGQLLVSAESDDRRHRRPLTPGDRYLAHALAITDRYVELCELERQHHFELLTFDAEPDSWRHYLGDHGHRQLKPDAFVIVADQDWEHRWFLEIDRATEHRPAIIRKATEYITYWRTGTEQRDTDTFPRVLWVVPDEPRRTALIGWLGSLDAETWQLFAVCTDVGFADAVTAGFNAEVST